MKMNQNEMETLYAFGCPNLKATVERLRMVAALAPDPVAKKLFYMLSVKLSAEGVERWYRCFYCKLRVLKNHREGCYDAVSYTHLDVYKRQVRTYQNRSHSSSIILLGLRL